MAYLKKRKSRQNLTYDILLYFDQPMLHGKNIPWAKNKNNFNYLWEDQ